MLRYLHIDLSLSPKNANLFVLVGLKVAFVSFIDIALGHLLCFTSSCRGFHTRSFFHTLCSCVADSDDNICELSQTRKVCWCPWQTCSLQANLSCLICPVCLRTRHTYCMSTFYTPRRCSLMQCTMNLTPL